jgi:hypothetical protein
MQVRGNVVFAIVIMAPIILLATLGTAYSSSGNTYKMLQQTNGDSGCSLDGLAICVITKLPPDANYSIDSWYPGGARSIRMRLENYAGSGWTSPNVNAQQALAMITQLKPDVLERMISQPYDSAELNQDVPVCSGCSPMTFLQFLDNATHDCSCYITPRLSVSSIDNGIAPPNDNLNDCSSPTYSGYFVCQAYAEYNTPITPHLEILSLDDWQSSCANDKNFNCGSCSWIGSVFQPLYAMGWKGVSTLNGGGYYSACGWATYVGFDSGSQINTGLLTKIQADPTVMRVFMYDPDFPGPAQSLQGTCSSSDPQNEYTGCDTVGSTVTMAAENQAKYSYTYVYAVEHTFWDTKRMFLSNGTSIYQLMSSLLSTYNSDNGLQSTSSTSFTTTSFSSNDSSESSLTTTQNSSTASQSSFSSKSQISSTTSATRKTIATSTAIQKSLSYTESVSSTTFDDSGNNSLTVVQFRTTDSAFLAEKRIQSSATTMAAGTGAMVFLAGLFPLSYIFVDGRRKLASRRRRYRSNARRRFLGGF